MVNADAARGGRWFGREVPMMTMSHQYLLTEPVKELEDWLNDKGTCCPAARCR